MVGHRDLLNVGRAGHGVVGDGLEGAVCDFEDLEAGEDRQRFDGELLQRRVDDAQNFQRPVDPGKDVSALDEPNVRVDDFDGDGAQLLEQFSVNLIYSNSYVRFNSSKYCHKNA